MNTRQLTYIKKVLEEGGISAAATSLRISQPSLSQMIKSVENSLGVDIFNRYTTPISLTHAGECYIQTAEQILNLEKQLHENVKEIKDEAYGRIRLGISMHRALTFLPEIIYLFTKEYPHVNIEVMELGSHKLEDYIFENKVDIAFVTTGQKNSQLIYKPIAIEKIFLVAGPNTAIAQKLKPNTLINIKEAKDEEFVFIKKGHAIRAIQEQLFHENSINPKAYFETDSIELARRIALYCDKVALYPKITGRVLPKEKIEGVYYEISRPNDYKVFCLAYRKNLVVKKYMEKFVQISLDYLKQLD